MFKKVAFLALIAALVCSSAGTPAFAQNMLLPDGKPERVNASIDRDSAGKKEAQPGVGLKADIQKLVADARAGTGISVSDPQNLPRQSNSLSKGAKIAIVAGIAVVVILAIVIVSQAKDSDFGPITIR